MDELTAVNICLRHSGDGHVNELDAGDGNSSLASTLIAEQRREILTSGWSFNTHNIDLNLNAAGRIPVAQSYLRIRLPEGIGINKDDADNKLYLWDIDQNQWYDQPLTDVEVVFDVTDLTKIPDPVGRYIAWSAAREYYASRNEGNEPPRHLQDRYGDAQSLAMNTEEQPNLNDATGWTTLSARTSTRINIDGEWVYP